jgi:hypothetical protein
VTSCTILHLAQLPSARAKAPAARIAKAALTRKRKQSLVLGPVVLRDQAPHARAEQLVVVVSRQRGQSPVARQHAQITVGRIDHGGHTAVLEDLECLTRDVVEVCTRLAATRILPDQASLQLAHQRDQLLPLQMMDPVQALSHPRARAPRAT